MLCLLTIYIIIYTLTTFMHRMGLFAGCTDLYCTIATTEDPNHLLVTVYTHKKTTSLNLNNFITHNLPQLHACSVPLPLVFVRSSSIWSVPASVVPLLLFKGDLPFLRTSELPTALWNAEQDSSVSSVKRLSCSRAREKHRSARGSLHAHTGASAPRRRSQR